MPPIDSADVLCHASVDTLCALVFATGTVRHRARSSRLAPAIRGVSPNVLRLESLSYARAACDWTRLAPDAVFRTSGLHLPDSDTSASNTAPPLPKRASNIAQLIPSPLPRPAARSAIPTALATAQDCYRTSVAQIGIRLRLRRQLQPRPASFYGHRFPLSYRA